MNTSYLVCLLCCEEFKSSCGGGDLGRKEENVQSLKQFSEVILKLDKNNLEGRKGFTSFYSSYEVENIKGDGGGGGRRPRGGRQSCDVSGGDKEEEDEHVNKLKEEEGKKAPAVPFPSLETKLAKFLKNPDDNLSICRDCLDLMKPVTEARLSAKCVEENVEKLQMLLLRELRRLQGRLDLFWKEFEKMEKTIGNGNLKLMEQSLDDSYSQKSEGWKKKRKTLDKISVEYLERRREIFGFREKIGKVFNEFHQFHSKITDTFDSNPTSQTNRTADPSKKMVDKQVQVEIIQKPKLKPADKQNQQGGDKALSLRLPSSPPPQIFNEICHDEDDDDVGNMDDEPMHLDNFDDNDSSSEHNQVEAKLADKRTSLRRRDKKKYEETSSHSNSEEDNDGEEYSPEVKKIKDQVKLKRRRVYRQKKDDKPNPKSLNEEEDEQKQDFGEDDDDEYKPEEPINQTLSDRAQLRNLLREYEPHLAQTSPFQGNLVRSILRFQFRCENQEKRKGPESLNVYQRHLVHLFYNLETQLINLKDIPIKILCQAEGEDDGENGLLCTKCDFKVPESPKMQTLMFDHVLSRHLNAYQCPHCQNNKLWSYEYYRSHVWKCRQESDVFKVECEICGKFLSDKRALRNHKWRAHMSEQEKKEALESGLVKDYAIKSKKGLDKTIQCEQCGKSFASKEYLQRHEKTHQDRNSREQFICSKCGKSFLRVGYKYHLKFSLSCGEDGHVETCQKCGRNFKAKFLLKRHMNVVHAEGELANLKPFICEICGKAFKKKKSLNLHESTHTGEKPWNCGKCGTAFSRQNNMRRHEKTCGK